MAVGIESNGYGSMSQKFLDEFRMDVSLEKKRGARMPEVVEGEAG